MNKYNTNRMQNLENIKTHPMLKNLFKRLTLEEYAIVVEFIEKHQHLDRNEYAKACNRLFLDKPKPKHHSDIWAIVLQCN